MIANQQLNLGVAAEVIPAFRRVTGGSGGIRLADIEPFLGTNIEDRDPAVPGRDIPTIHPTADGIHNATVGNNTAIPKWSEIEALADGKVGLRVSGKAIGVALEEVPANSNGGYFRVIYYPHSNPTDTKNIVASGTHTWAGGAATTDSIAVAGLLETDIVLCTLVARNSTETLVLAVNDHANDQIDLTLSANGTNGTTKINYLVLR